YSYCVGNSVAGEMMIPDDEINSFSFRIIDFLNSFDATIQSNNQREAIFCCVINPFERNAVSLQVSIGYIKFQTRMKIPEKTVDNRNSGSAIDIIIAVYQNLLLIANRFFNSGYRFIHIFHQKRIVQ